MKKTKLTLGFYFFCLLQVFGQSEYWETNYVTVTGGNRINSTIFEKDNTFVSLSGRILYENSYFLELNDFLSLPLEGSGFEAHYFYGAEIENNGDPFYFGAERTGDNDNKIYLNTFTKTELLQSAFEIPDLFEETQSKGPAAILSNGNEVMIFGNQAFHKISLSTNGEITLDWSKPATFGMIADAKEYNGGYIICNENGFLVHVDALQETVWQTNLGYPIRGVLVLSDGFMLAAEIDEEIALVKTDFSGSVQWERKYGEGYSVDLDFSSDNGIIFTGKGSSIRPFLIKADIAGEVIWENHYEEIIGQGSRILNSKFEGYMLQTKGQIATHILRIKEDGSTGDFLQGPPPKKIEANNLESTAFPRGQLFWDGDDISTTFPKDSSTTTIFAGGLWISGVDQDGVLHSALNLYGNLSDFRPGPFNAPNQDFQSWEKVWKITKDQIANFREDIQDGVLDRPLPIDFWSYPGSENPHFNILTDGNATVPANMAPFIDVNNDGIYNVLDGDYPDIKGDEMIWWVMRNDISGSNINGGIPFDFEIRGSLYAYDCDASDILYNSEFLEIDIINYSNNEYSDVYVGTFVDYDLGCYLDDYNGTIPETNSSFVYNADAIDNEACSGISNFPETSIPIQSVTYLNHDLDYSRHFVNTFIGPAEMGEPGTPTQLHDFLQGFWIDGTPQTEGGDGYGGSEPINYSFPGNPSDANAWSMCTSNLMESDRRMVMVTGPKTIALNDTFSLDIGLLAHQNISYPCPDITEVKNQILEFQDIYESQGYAGAEILGDDQVIMEGETIVLDASFENGMYTWSTGDTTQTIEITIPGIYSVLILTETGCRYTDEIQIFDPTNVNEIQAAAPKVYPNPTNGSFYIELQNDLPELIILENILGQKIESKNISRGLENTIIEWNSGYLNEGIYLLRFEYGKNKKTLIRKLIVTE